jgi:hypothetical protein
MDCGEAATAKWDHQHKAMSGTHFMLWAEQSAKYRKGPYRHNDCGKIKNGAILGVT